MLNLALDLLPVVELGHLRSAAGFDTPLIELVEADDGSVALRVEEGRVELALGFPDLDSLSAFLHDAVEVCVRFEASRLKRRPPPPPVGDRSPKARALSLVPYLHAVHEPRLAAKLGARLVEADLLQRSEGESAADAARLEGIREVTEALRDRAHADEALSCWTEALGLHLEGQSR